MRITNTDERFYHNGRPMFWHPQVEAVWRAHPEVRSEEGAMRDGGRVMVIDTPIFPEFDIEGRLRRTIDAVGPTGTIVVEINSPGGDVFTGNALQSRIRAHVQGGGQVHGLGYGAVASAAQYITLPMTSVGMAEDAFMMIHRVQSFGILSGDYEEIARDAATQVSLVKSANKLLVRGLASKMGIPGSRVDAMLKATTWMTAAEAVEARLADYVTSVVEQEEDEPPVTAERDGRVTLEGLADAIRASL